MDTEFEDQLVELSEWRNEHFFGKYRGTVAAVEDGDKLGIISVKVHEVFGADYIVDNVRPCSPFAGSKHGFVAIPEVGDGVWVEFEAGKTSLPIWTGFWWADGELPGPKGKLVRSFITTKGHQLLLDDDANEITLRHAAGAELKMTDGDITIEIGSTSIAMTKSNITLKVGASVSAPSVKITSTSVTVQASPIGSVKLTPGGVDIGSGAMKIGV